jgi:hypothetical protein
MTSAVLDGSPCGEVVEWPSFQPFNGPFDSAQPGEPLKFASGIGSLRRPNVMGFDVLVAEAFNLILAALFIKAEFRRGHHLTLPLP